MIFEIVKQAHIYSLRKLVMEFDIPTPKYKDRPYWERDYLILKRVPAAAINPYVPAGHDKRMLLWSYQISICVKSRSPTPQLPVPQLRSKASRVSICGASNRFPLTLLILISLSSDSYHEI